MFCLATLCAAGITLGTTPASPLNDPSTAYIKAVEVAKNLQRSGAHRGNLTSGWWNPLGPKWEWTRVRSYARWSTTTQHILGSAGGGIFLRRVNPSSNFMSWYQRDYYSGISTVSDIKFNPFDSNHLYVSTGDGYGEPLAGPREHRPTPGTGVYQSFDGGNTYKRLPSTIGPNWTFVNKLTLAPNQNGRIFASTGSGLYKSDNGGLAWMKVLDGWVCDMEIAHASPLLAIATVRGEGIYKSTNGGDTWTLATAINAERIEASIAKTASQFVYATVSSNNFVTLWRSTNNGDSFEQTSAPASPTIGGYSNAIQVIDSNPLHVMYGGKYLYRSLDAGQTASIAFTNQPHYIQSIAPMASGQEPGYLYISTHGGLVSGTYTNTTLSGNFYNLNCAQVNFISLSKAGTKVAGANGGVFFYPGGLWSLWYSENGGPTTHDWTHFRRFYTSLPSGQIRRYEYNIDSIPIEGGSQPITDVDPLKRNYYSPILLDPNEPNRLYAGRRQLWRSVNALAAEPHWVSIKGDIGGEGDPSQYDDPRNISAIEVCKGNSALVLVGYNNGQVWRSVDATSTSPTWSRVGEGVLPGRKVTKIVYSPTNTNIAFICYDGWASDNLWMTTNGGDTWTNIGTVLPQVPYFSIACHPIHSGWIYLATEVGLFASEDNGQTWGTPFDGPGVVRVTDLKFYANGGDVDAQCLVASTYGKGVFVNYPSLPGYFHAQPEDFRVTRGRIDSGGLDDVHRPDDSLYMDLLPSFTGQRGDPNFEVEFETSVPSVTFNQINFGVEARGNADNQVNWNVAIYDYLSSQWVDGSMRSLTLNENIAAVSSNAPAQFIGPNGKIKARVQGFLLPNAQRNANMRIDYAIWTFTR